jgi:anti-sigma regulatory factor (Ser/Thr protein kinase)
MTSTMLGDRIVIGNDISELRRMSEWLRTIVAETDLPGELLYRLDVIANEAVTNIISYAYDDAARHDITLELTKSAGGATLVIRDDGKPFNVLDVPARQPPKGLDDAAIGGIGIHLIRRLTSRCDYRREGRFNVLSLETEHAPQPRNA